MRFSASVLLALPILASAAEGPFDQYIAQFQNFLGSFGAKVPSSTTPAGDDTSTADAAPSVPEVDAKVIERLTLDNYNETLYGPVVAGATQPEEWWVLISGRNKTCFGHCVQMETAFNESAERFAALPSSPHLGLVDCDDQPVLCNSWSASTGTLWILDVLPAPAPVEIYRKRLNLTTTTADTILDLYADEGRRDVAFKRFDGKWFHPFDGILAQNKLSVPMGYALMYFNMVPSWVMMLGISFISRTMMNRRMDTAANRGPGAPAPARAAPAART